MASARDRRQMRAGVDFNTRPEGLSMPLREMDRSLFSALQKADGGASVNEDGSIQIGSFQLTARGMVADAGATFDEWEMIGGVLRRLEASIQWLIGDWFVYGETAWGQTYEAIAEATGYGYQTLRDYAYVARNVDLSIRIDKLSFAHHRLVAAMTPELQAGWLAHAARHERMSISKLRQEMALINELDDAQQIAWLDYAANQQQLLSQMDEFKPPALPSGTGEDALKSAATDWSYIRDTFGQVEKLDGKSRQDALKRVARMRDLLDAYERRLRG